MIKAAVVALAIEALIKRGYSEWVVVQSKFNDVQIGFTSDCPENVKKVILTEAKQILMTVVAVGDDDYGKKWGKIEIVETDVRFVTRNRKMWR